MNKYLISYHDKDGGLLANGIEEALDRKTAFAQAERGRHEYRKLTGKDAVRTEVSREPVDQCDECKYLINRDGRCACP